MIQEGLVVAALLSICQDVLKIDNLLHEWGFVDSQMKTIVTEGNSIIFRSKNQGLEIKSEKRYS